MILLDILRRLFHREPIPPGLGRAPIWYEGGNGLTPENPVIVRGANYDLEGTAAEFAWIAMKFGQKDVDWRLVCHATGQFDDRRIDTFVLRLPNGQEIARYFDVTESFGR